MKEISKKITDYMNESKLSIQELSIKMGFDQSKLSEIISGDYNPTKDEIKAIEEALNDKPKISTGKRIVKILDLVFRLGAFIMGLVTLLLCIDGNVAENILVALLAVGMVCNSMILLPKIDK